MRDIRLGDDIDDYCVRCKRVMNHAVVSVINAAAAKVRCRTCHSDHDYRHEQAPPPKVDARKSALFQEVLKKVNPNEAIVDVDPEEIPEVEVEAEPEVEVEVDLAEPEIAVADEAPVVEQAPLPKAKAKAKAKGKGKKK
jgi:hypothetical protein